MKASVLGDKQIFYVKPYLADLGTTKQHTRTVDGLRLEDKVTKAHQLEELYKKLHTDPPTDGNERSTKARKTATASTTPTKDDTDEHAMIDVVAKVTDDVAGVDGAEGVEEMVSEAID